MSFLRIAALVLGIFLGLFLLGSLLLPGEVKIARNIEIDAAPEQVFPFVNDLEAFNRWSPWAAMDGDAEYQLSGPESGVGARMTWSSEDPEVGSGSQEIIRSRPPERVVMMLEFSPSGSAEASFDLEPVEAGTSVTWNFGYEIGFDPIGRYVGLLLKGLVGKKYEEGLDRLKRLVETGQA